MKTIKLYAKGLMMLIAVAALIASCKRRPLEEEFVESALIPVKIDWSNSGINVVDPTGNGEVHRVSLRFFPKDGSPAFDRYLEGNVIEGKIEVPVGQYSVVVFNESIYDKNYWDGVINFSNVDNYSLFTANIVSDNPAKYSYYSPAQGEKLIVEPCKLASWSLGAFEVTAGMAQISHGYSPVLHITMRETEMMNALTQVVMRRLTYRFNITAHVESLCSAQRIRCAGKIFADRVNMASAHTSQSVATHMFSFKEHRYDETEINGTAHTSFLSFGRIPAPESYLLDANLLLISGSIYTPPSPLRFDVTDQVVHNTEPEYDIHIYMRLPYIEGGINVDDWDDETQNIE